MYERLLNWQSVVRDKLANGTKLRKNQLKSLVKVFEWLKGELPLHSNNEVLMVSVEKSLNLCVDGFKNKELSDSKSLSLLFDVLGASVELMPNEKFDEARERLLTDVQSLRDKVDYFLVCDLEMTCEDGVRFFPSETLDVGMVVLDAKTLREVDRFESLVKPVVRPLLTNTCVKLTKLTQEMVDKEREYPEVAKELRAFVFPYRNSRFLQWGSADARQLSKDDERCGLEPTLCGVVPYNLKEVFYKVKKAKYKYSLNTALSALSLERYGQEHRAFSDAMDTANVARNLFLHVEKELLSRK